MSRLVIPVSGGYVHLYESHGFEIEGRMRQEMLLPDGSYADDLWFALFLE